METVRVGFVGLGMRGPGAVERFTHLRRRRDQEGPATFTPSGSIAQQAIPRASRISSRPRLQRRRGVETALRARRHRSRHIVTPWQKHVPMAVYAMKQGKHVAVEVPAATSLDECWQLVNTAEKTRRHCMMLENCVYDFFGAHDAQHGQTGAVRRHPPCRGIVYPQSGCLLGLLRGQLAPRLQPKSTAATFTPRTASAPPASCWTSTAATR